jgi:hypothetical protein
MLDAGVPLAKFAEIVGWAPSTMVRMAAKYGHFNTDELRSAAEKISKAESNFSGLAPVSGEGVTRSRHASYRKDWLLR